MSSCFICSSLSLPLSVDLHFVHTIILRLIMGKTKSFKDEFTFGLFFLLFCFFIITEFSGFSFTVCLYMNGSLFAFLISNQPVYFRGKTRRIPRYYCQIRKPSSCKFTNIDPSLLFFLHISLLEIAHLF